MQDRELNEFIGLAIDAFPGLGAFVAEHPAVVKSWGKTLSNVTAKEAMGVLSRWVDGSLSEPPVGYRRELFALDVRAVAMRGRNDFARERASVEAREKALRKSQPSAAFRSILVPFTKILELRSKVMRGELDVQECDRQIQQIVEAF
jgi:hypothetical protein